MKSNQCGPYDQGSADSICAVDAGGATRSVGDWPGVASLIRGEPFLGNDLRADVTALLEEAGSTLGNANLEQVAVPGLLEQLRAGHTSLINLLMLAVTFERLTGTAAADTRGARAFADRCRFYCAIAGHVPSGWKVAGRAVEIAYRRDLPDPLVVPHVIAAAAWLNVAAGTWRPPQDWTAPAARSFLDAVITPDGIGAQMVRRMLLCRQQLLSEAREVPKQTAVSATVPLLPKQTIPVRHALGPSRRKRPRTLH